MDRTKDKERKREEGAGEELSRGGERLPISPPVKPQGPTIQSSLDSFFLSSQVGSF